MGKQYHKDIHPSQYNYLNSKQNLNELMLLFLTVLVVVDLSKCNGIRYLKYDSNMVIVLYLNAHSNCCMENGLFVSVAGRRAKEMWEV